VSDTTANQGTGDVTVSTWTRFYLSTTPYWTTATVYLGVSRSVPPLVAGAASSGTSQVTIPAGTAGGAYYLLAWADGPNAVAESDENNQQRASAIQITGGSGGSPDLVVS